MGEHAISVVYWAMWGRMNWSCSTHLQSGTIVYPDEALLEFGAHECEQQSYHENQRKTRPDIASATP